MSAPKCYICYDEHSEENPLMSSVPCICKGSCNEIHYTCFEGIRRKRICPNCNCSLPLTPVVPDDMISASDEDHLYYWKEDSQGNKHGPFYEFVKYNLDGNNMYIIQRQGTFIHGSKEGIWYIWRPDGNLSMECHYKDGKHHGEQKKIMPNGSIVCWTTPVGQPLLIRTRI